MTIYSIPVSIARSAIETYFITGEHLVYNGEIPVDIRKRSGVFVCLKIEGDLRGCIGTIEPVTDSVAEEIVKNAISSATKDPRFSPVRADEINRLSYSVDIIGSPELVNSVLELDPKRYGVIVSHDKARGLLLPDLEGVETSEQQIEIALGKAGIPNASDFDIYRFEVKRYT